MQFDVGIVGFGPVGATLATLLAKQGLSIAMLERDGAPASQPRAGHIDGEVMRVFQAAGIAEELAPTLRVGVGMKFVSADGRLLLDWPRPQEIGLQDWYASYRFHQPTLERLLRAEFARVSSHPARLRCDTYALEEGADGVTIRYEDLSRGTLEALRCRFVVGCDGGRSTVRRFMGSVNRDLGSHERWLVVDIELNEAVDTLEAATVQICDPARAVTVAQMAGNRRRWEFRLIEGDDFARITEPESVWALLAPWVRPDQAKLERAVVYTFHATIVDGWRRGRMLVAGDAAHQMPPFMGQGLCSGIRDASNLAWKLAAVVGGQAADTLLDSYEAERGPHVHAFIREAMRLGEIIQATGPEVAGRDQRMAANPEFLKTVTPRLGAGLHGNAPAPAGTLAPQPRLGSGIRLDDQVGSGFVLLATEGFGADPALTALLHAAGVPLVPGAATAWLDTIGAKAALIRPDRYVLGVVNSVEDVSDLLEAVPASRMPAHAA